MQNPEMPGQQEAGPPAWGLILAALDGSQASMAAVGVAAALARYTGATLTIVHVAQPLVSSFDRPRRWSEAQEAAQIDAQRLLDHARALYAAELACTTEVLFGEPATVIRRRAEELNAGLIVVGSRGLGALGRLLLGSVSSAISQQAPCSVLIVRERVSGPS